MKTCWLTGCFIFVLFSALGQVKMDSNSVAQQNYDLGKRDYHLKMADNYRTAGNVLVVSGALAVLGGLIYSKSETSEGLDMDFTAPALVLGGLAGMGLSAVFYGVSARNARLAIKYAKLYSLPRDIQASIKSEVHQIVFAYTLRFNDLKLPKTSRK